MPPNPLNAVRRLWLVAALILVAVVVWIFLLGPNGFFGGRQPRDVHSAAHGHEEHEEHEPMIETVAWNDRLELFVSHHVVVAGEPFEIELHATSLDTGQPLEKGAAKAEVTGNGSVQEAASAEPAEAGVWLLPLEMEEPGEYQVDLRFAPGDAESGSFQVPMQPLAVYASAEEAHEAEEAIGSEEVTAVEFPKEQQWRIGLKTEVIARQTIAETLVVPGEVVAPHGAETMIVPPIPGRVIPPADGQFPQIGDRVEAGQLLAAIEPSVAGAQSVQLLVNQAQLKTLDADLAAKQLEIEGQIAAAQVDLELANSELERLSGLSGGGVVAEKRLIEARHRVRQTEAALQGYQRLRETYTQAHDRLTEFLADVRATTTAEDGADSLTVPLRSPLGGTVVDSEVTDGEFVGDDHTLFRIVDMQKLHIDAQVSEYDLARVEQSPGARFRLSAYPDRILPIYGPGEGRLVFLGGVVDADSRTVTVRYEVPNDRGLLRVGMFADVIIDTARRDKGIVVPEDAVVDDNGEPIVYVQTGGQAFRRQPVQLGIRDGDRLEVRRGLEEGERVVVDGAYAIRLSTLAGGVPEHHHHH